MFTLYATRACSKRKELVLHLVFEIELLGGIEGTLYTDELSVGMGHEVIYGLIIEVRVNGDVSCLNTISGFVHPILSKLRLQL